MRTLTLLLIAGLLALAGCGSLAADEVEQAGADFVATDDDPVARCALLAETTRTSFEADEGQPCDEAIEQVPVGAGEVTAVEVWGEFLITYTLIDDQTKLTAAVGYAMVSMISPSLSQVRLADLSVYGVNNAAAVLLMLPAVIVYIALQRWFVRGILEGVLKF